MSQSLDSRRSRGPRRRLLTLLLSAVVVLAGVVLAPAVQAAPPDTVSFSVVPANQRLDVSFNYFGDATGVSFEYSLDGGLWRGGNFTFDPAAFAGQGSINGLVNAQVYSLRLRAVNADGPGAASDPQAVSPGVPTAPALFNGVLSVNGGVKIPYGEPSADGGSPVTGYEISATTDPKLQNFKTAIQGTDALLGNVLTLNGLANGTLYYIAVRSRNTNGAGISAVPTPAAVIPGRPTAPQFVNATPADQGLKINFNLPASDGGIDATPESVDIVSYDYSVTTVDGQRNWQPNLEPVTDDGGNLSFPVNGLRNGVKYYVAVRARNTEGAGVPSDQTEQTPDTVSSPPTNVSAVASVSGAPSVAGTGYADVSFTPPADNGGEQPTPPTGFVASSSPEGLTSSDCTVSACRVNGLTNGISYTFTVVASNNTGPGAPSAASKAVTPVGAPYAPRTIQRASANPVSVTVSFAPPVFSGAPVTRYQISSDNGKKWREVAVRKSGSRLLATAPYLRSGVRHAVRVRAVNIVRSIARAGVPSSAVTVLTGPSVVVGQPSVRVGTAAARVQWPVSREPDVIGYTVVSSRGAVCTTGTRLETSCIVGARAGSPTTFRVYARSSAGSSYPSKPTRAVVAAMPAVSRSTPGVPGGFSTKPKSVRSGRASTFVAPGYLPGSTVRMVVYGQRRHVMTATVASSRGLAGVTMTVPRDAARTLTFVIFGVTPYASSKAVGASIRRS